MRYKHIIFDVDGTLLDTEACVLHSLRETIRVLQQRDVEDADLLFALGIPGEVTLRKLGVEDTAAGNKIWNGLFKKHFQTVKLFDGIVPLLDKLKTRGYELGIITSKNREEFTNDFEPFGITSYFGTIICVTDSPRPKPSPDPMFAYLAKAGIDQSEAIYIGDSPYDMRCAQSAGVDFGLAVWGCRSLEPMKVAYHFDTPRDILNL